MFDFVPLPPSSTQDPPKQTTEKTEKSEETESSRLDDSGSKPVHKWPIRPGVHVHVNGLHALGGIATVAGGSVAPGFSYGAKNSTGSSGSETSQNDSGNPVPEPVSEPVPKDESGNDKVAKGTSTDSSQILNNNSAMNNNTIHSPNNTHGNSPNNNSKNNSSNAKKQSNEDVNSSKSNSESKGITFLLQLRLKSMVITTLVIPF